jgi:hypothetical protein
MGVSLMHLRPQDVLSLTVNVACKFCPWVGVYPVGEHEEAAKDGAKHIFSAHPELAK